MTSEEVIALLGQHIPSITDEIEDELIALVANVFADEGDTADLALRICHCGARIDGFYEYVDHLNDVFRAQG